MTPRLLAPLALAMAVVTGCPAAVPDTTKAATPSGRIVLPDTIVPRHYDVSVEPDVSNLTFKGAVAIQLTVRTPTDRIVLNSADIVIDRATLSGMAAAPGITYDKQVETTTFAFVDTLKPGDYTLSIDYHGRIFQQASGLFALDYDTAQGRKRALFTQFENSDARRFVPCWDEPGIKTTFTLTAAVPADLMAVSNMPVAATEELPGKLKRVRFAESPKMSSYLLFFGLGDFERVQRSAAGVDVGVIVKRGDKARGEFALGVACQLLPYYNEYFGVPYPLPKLDLIAAPGQSQFFGAMENWGAIFYFERVLLFDPRLSTELDKQRIYSVVAHEMAHQWFGDLVTMSWWDDLWLNEGFASWMAAKVTDHFHPEWNVWLQALGTKQAAMQMDARDGTHAIITPINDVFQAAGAFDSITYQKGQAVIRMLEAYVGEDAFRAGVRHYMKNHAYGNTTTDELWSEIDSVSPRKLTDIAHDFTLQAGVPLMTVAPGEGGLRLAESRFALDESGASGGSWRIPAIVAGPAGAELPAAKHVEVTAGQPAIVVGARPGFVVNSGQSAYFRTLYQGEAFTALSRRYGRLPPDDQLGILNDVATLGFAGHESMADFLDLTLELPPDANPVIWKSLIEWLAGRAEAQRDGRAAGLDQAYDGLPEQKAFRDYARSVLAPVFRRVGWDPQPGEPENMAILRGVLLGALGRLDDPAVADEARRRFDRFLKDPGSLTGSARSTMLQIVASGADAVTWEQLRTLGRNAGSWLEKQEYYNLLGCAADPALAQRALDLTLTDETAPTLRPAIASTVAVEHPEMAFDFVVAHWDVFGPLIEYSSQSRYVPGLLTNSTDTRTLDRLAAFAAAHIPSSAMQDMHKTAAVVRYNASIRTERLPEINRWLANRSASSAR
jgi:aminopeptidase N